MLAQMFVADIGCGFRAVREGRCRSVESHDRYVFWLTGRAHPRSIRQHMDDFDAQGNRFGRRNAAASQCTRCLTNKLKGSDLQSKAPSGLFRLPPHLSTRPRPYAYGSPRLRAYTTAADIRSPDCFAGASAIRDARL